MLITCTNGFGALNIQTYYIVLGENASMPEQLTASHFKMDLENATGCDVKIITTSNKIFNDGTTYLIGSNHSNSIISELSQIGKIKLSEEFPGERGGIWNKTMYKGNQVIVLGGSDIQGTQYAVYDYCKEILKADPFSYWTGTKTEIISDFDPFDFLEKTIYPPQVPILCYFENDVDELANLKEPLLEYDWEHYSQMINSLVRLKYNAIQLFDMLGRPEFFKRIPYQQLRPDYDIKIDYIEKMIDYAHDMGMMVQIDMALGYKIKPMEQEYADCWKDNKQKWIDAWKYYFEETPLGKADIFSLRPRNQVWDWEYKSSCGEDKIEVFNEVFAEFGTLVDSYNKDAIKVVICYSDGMEMFNDGFNPPNDFIIAWSDDGFGGFKYYPKDTKGYNFGTYMHAGFWLNHTVHDPYPEKVDSVMKYMFNKYNADKYLQVNGQTFRPFLINLEAYSEVANKPEVFDGDEFYSNWTQRYFNKSASEFAIKSMKKLHEAQFNRGGYVENLWIIKSTIAYLTDMPIERPGKEAIPESFDLIENHIEEAKLRENLLTESLQFAEKGNNSKSKNDEFYHDYILLPVNIYLDLIKFENNLLDLSLLKNKYEENKNEGSIKKSLLILDEAKKNLKTIYDRRMSGDKNQLWKGWYDPAIRRPNNGFPTFDDLEKIKINILKISGQNK
ncbi:MAG: glycosyl hydrolase 115 family protein [Ignavibacteriae bacterium]|nr:glycosyl hydrolase 115 family protein [Ignavibacteriota bacterium]